MKVLKITIIFIACTLLLAFGNRICCEYWQTQSLKMANEAAAAGNTVFLNYYENKANGYAVDSYGEYVDMKVMFERTTK